jgi:hypothetical protein
MRFGMITGTIHGDGPNHSSPDLSDAIMAPPNPIRTADRALMKSRTRTVAVTESMSYGWPLGLALALARFP